MWWHSGSPRQDKSAFWLVIFIAIGVAMMSGHAFGGQWWLFLLIPLFLSGASRRRRYYGNWDRPADDEFEKPKHDFEKPKRESQFIRSDDGELLEVIEDEPRRARRHDADAETDDNYYV